MKKDILTTAINVPSGRLVIANDLRELGFTERFHNVNTPEGTQGLMDEYALSGVAMVYVGYSDPEFYQREGHPNAVFVGEAPEGANIIGRVMTSLWWYCAMDENLFLDRCAKKNKNPKDFTHFTIEVEPGVYGFADLLTGSTEESFALSAFGKIDVPAPRLLDEATNSPELGESAFMRTLNNYAKHFDGHYFEALDDIFMTLGNGANWQNGLLMMSDNQSEDVAHYAKPSDVPQTRTINDIPVLKRHRPSQRVYPLSEEYSVLRTAPLNIDIFWLAAGMTYLRTMEEIDYDVIFRNGNHKSVLSSTKEAVRLSLNALCAIAQERGLVGTPEFESAIREVAKVLEDNAVSCGPRVHRFSKIRDEVMAEIMAAEEHIARIEADKANLRPSDIISDEEVDSVHGSANFGEMSKRDVIDDGVLKTALGFDCGSTKQSILIKHCLAIPGIKQDKLHLLTKGRDYLVSVFGEHDYDSYKKKPLEERAAVLQDIKRRKEDDGLEYSL